MSEEQLSAFLAALKADAGLQEKLKGAADIDAVVAIAVEAGFGVSKADWVKYQANQNSELSDEELEGVAGGAQPNTVGKLLLGDTGDLMVTNIAPVICDIL